MMDSTVRVRLRFGACALLMVASGLAQIAGAPPQSANSTGAAASPTRGAGRLQRGINPEPAPAMAVTDPGLATP